MKCINTFLFFSFPNQHSLSFSFSSIPVRFFHEEKEKGKRGWKRKGERKKIELTIANWNQFPLFPSLFSFVF